MLEIQIYSRPESSSSNQAKLLLIALSQVSSITLMFMPTYMQLSHILKDSDTSKT